MQKPTVYSELRNYYNDYPQEHYLNLPELAVEKLGLDRRVLDDLPHVRNREDIFNWMANQNFSLGDLEWLGW
jgi:hypothetical protein|tara:strand:+ start:3554 stop:3769 length:216 start_codon:yes stop_codon:yes gene_type:complete